MTIQREYRSGPFVVQCNTCSDTEELEGTSFSEALADSKDRGFKAKVVDGEWQHTCRSC